MALNIGDFVMCRAGTQSFEVFPGRAGRIIEQQPDGKFLVDFGNEGQLITDEDQLQITRTLSQRAGIDPKIPGHTIAEAKEELLFWLQEWVPAYDPKRIRWSAVSSEILPDGRTVDVLTMTYHFPPGEGQGPDNPDVIPIDDFYQAPGKGAA